MRLPGYESGVAVAANTEHGPALDAERAAQRVDPKQVAQCRGSGSMDEAVNFVCRIL